MTLAIWQIYLIATVVIESVIAAPMAPRDLRRRTVDCCILANLFTHPPANLLLFRGIPLGFVELLVIAVEAVAYRFAAGLPWRRALRISVVANVVTWVLSLLF
jgi:hypothetical protein